MPIQFGPTAGEGIGQGLGTFGQLPDMIRDEKLKILQQQVQSAQAGGQLEDFYRAQAQAHPEYLWDKKFQALVQQNQQRSGMPQLPMDPARAAVNTPDTPSAQAPGGSYPGIHSAAAPAQLNENAFFGGSAKPADFFSKYAQQISDSPNQASKDALFKGVEGRDPNPSEEKTLGSINVGMTPQQTQTDQDNIMKSFQTSVKTAFNAGDTTQVQVLAKSTIQQLLRLHPGDPSWPDQVNGMLEPFFNDGIADLSPMQAAKLRTELSKADKNDATVQSLLGNLQIKSAETQPLIDERLSISRANDARVKDILAKLPYEGRLAAARIRNLNASANAALDRGANSNAEALWYTDRADDMQGKGQVMSPQERSSMRTALTKVIGDNQTAIDTLTNGLSGFEKSLNTDQASRTAAAPQIRAWQKQITDLTNQNAAYKQHLNSMMTGNYGNVPGVYSPYDQQGGNPYDPNQPASPQQAQPTRTGKTASSGDPNQPKMYQYSDGSWRPN